MDAPSPPLHPRARHRARAMCHCSRSTDESSDKLTCFARLDQLVNARALFVSLGPSCEADVVQCASYDEQPDEDELPLDARQVKGPRTALSIASSIPEPHANVSERCRRYKGPTLLGVAHIGISFGAADSVMLPAMSAIRARPER